MMPGRGVGLAGLNRWLAPLLTAALVLTGVTALATMPSAAAATSPCGAGINPIVCENRQPGTPESVWNVPGAGDPSIQGFATDISVNAGNPISFKISTTASAYTIDIYRLGYYGGNGARKVASVTPVGPQNQPACATAPTGLYDCGTWAVSATWAVPSSAVSGVYLADLTRTDTGGMSQITFIVRNDSSTSDIVYQTSDETWEAYNRYGGGDFYTGNEQAIYDSPNRARQISYNRPFLTRGDSSGRDFLFSNEYPTIRYLEQNGYDVTYIAGVDTDRYGSTLLANHKVFLSVGHDEYWSLPQRTNVQNALAGGLNLMFLSGNEVFWHTRFAPSIDGSATPYRTLICYKDTWDNKVSDPSGESTGTWRDPRFSAAPGGSSPENALTGTIYMANSDDLPLTITAAQGQDRLWRNTGLSTMSGASTTVAQHVVGYESDEDLDNGFRNPGEIDLSTTVGASPQELTDFGQVTAAGTTTHHITLYRAPSGALVFGAGTIQWGWGLDADHDGTQTPASPQMRQMMINLFADMKVQPGSLAPDLVPASASTDTTAPTSTITSPGNGAAVANGTSLTVTGTASDVGGVVAGVEVSIDGGSTWHPAAGTTSWSYTGIVHGSGSVTILSRATDDSVNTEKPGPGVTITTSCPCSLFGQATPKVVDSGDAYRAELGVRFSPDTDGYVTGIRFYKATANTGTHIGTLWSASGTSLATGTFTNETASGWQTLQFPAPVPVSANTTYVAGYWAPNGHYSEDDYVFYYRDLAAAPLHAQSNSPTDASKQNGVYASTNSFPTQTSLGANYSVDPLFAPGATGMPSVVATSPSAGGTGVPASTTPSATFSTAVTPGSITFTVSGSGGGAVAGTVSYDAPSKTATFTPSAALSPGTSYTASVSATSTTGTAMVSPYTWTFTTAGSVTCPCTLFATAAVPSGVDSGDRSALSVGTQFTASVSGYITGERFYKAAANTGSHTASLWTSGGTLLATATYSGESASGWQTVAFPSPVAITAGTTYVVSYYAPSGHYSEDDHYFDVPVTNGPLTGPAGAGVYAYGSNTFPTSTYANANYWVDPIFTTVAGPAGPTVTSTTPAAAATGVTTSVTPSAVFSASLNPSSVSVSLTSGSGAVTGTTAYDDSSHRVTFTPSAPLTAGTSYTATVSAVGANGAAMSGPYTWSFTTAAAPATCPCGLFPAGASPTTVDSGDGSALSLGVRFSSSVDGTVTGVRFYKAAANRGTHTGSLWSATGTLLATATFSGESASGWQTVTFANPVTITAGTTYVAGYFAPSGHYAEDDHYFDAPVSNAPLTAPAGAGVYAYGGDTFPSSSYANANYWVDPVFTTGGSSPPPAPAPAVSSYAPADGTTNASTATTPSATFSTPVTPSTIAFVVSGPTGLVTGTVAYAAGTQTAVFTPATPLAGGTTYAVSVLATSVAGTPMSAPRTWSFTTAVPPDTTPPVISAVTATGSGTSATVTWTTNEASTSSVAYGTTSGTLGSTASGSGLSTTHSVTLSGLAPNTRYYYRVTSADAAGNTAVSPASPAAPASYAPTIAPVTDTTTSQFASGTPSSTYAASNGDGEVVLTPKSTIEFTGTTLPSGLTSSTLVSGGRTTVAAGAATVSGATLTTSALYGNGVSLETRAILRPNQKLGWGTPLNPNVKIAFSVNSSNQLVASENDGFLNNASSVVATGWTPAAHTFRLEWTSSAVTFYLDNTQVWTHAFMTLYASTYKPSFTDNVTTDGGLVVQWARIGPYAASGSYTSRVFDAQAPVTWGALSWDSTVPTGTTLSVKVRTGPTATPGSSWTAWTAVPQSGAAAGGTARYLQYQLTLTSSGSRFVTPAVRSVTIAAAV